ncbi:hypothetical protein GCM10017776_13400 [Streptomyces griseoluteus]|nr:hypothetical protein GCM10017776_13400 [Streptomyces griseoluteus]
MASALLGPLDELDVATLRSPFVLSGRLYRFGLGGRQVVTKRWEGAAACAQVGRRAPP